MDDVTTDFLTKVGIDCAFLATGNELRLDRDALMHSGTYDIVAVMIPELKRQYSSSSMTGLQKNAKDSQRWPLLNLTRQILKSKRLLYETMPNIGGTGRIGQESIQKVVPHRQEPAGSRVLNICECIYIGVHVSGCTAGRGAARRSRARCSSTDACRR